MENIKKENLRIDENGNIFEIFADGEIKPIEGEILIHIQKNIFEYGLGFYEYKNDNERYGYIIEPKEINERYSILRAQNNSNCFGCGLENKIGLGINFIIDKSDNSSYAWTSLSRQYEGWEKVVHGGII